MTATLVLTRSIVDDLMDAAGRRVESGAVLLARYVDTPNGNVRLLGHTLQWVPEAAYRTRTAYELVVGSEGYVSALAAAEAHGSVPIWVHTHPGSSPLPSGRDLIVDAQLSDLFRLRAGSRWYGALIVGRFGGSLTFTGHIESENSRVEIDRVWTTGDRWALVPNWLHAPTPPDAMFDRSIRAFGGGIQSVLAQLRVAVVGCGGTGSSVVEQLARLGVRRFYLFDPKELTDTNVTRVYGSHPGDVGDPKVQVLAELIRRIAPDTEVEAVQSSITQQDAARRLLDADVIFGCSDDNAGRLVLSRIATYFMTPVIDCGVKLTSSDDGSVEGIYGRVTVLGPGAACLDCRGRIDMRRATAEVMAASEHRRLAAEGYAAELPEVEPAVVAYTTLVAAAAVGELIERLVHHGPEQPPTEQLLRIHEREVSTNTQPPQEGHYCDPVSGKLGLGLTEPFLGRTWPC